MEVNAELIKAMQVRNYSTKNIRARFKDQLQYANSVALTWLGSTMKPSWEILCFSVKQNISVRMLPM